MTNDFIKENTKRISNQQNLQKLNKGICPSCKEAGVIKEAGQNSWECFRCHSFFQALYVDLPRHTQKPSSYKG